VKRRSHAVSVTARFSEKSKVDRLLRRRCQPSRPGRKYQAAKPHANALSRLRIPTARQGTTRSTPQNWQSNFLQKATKETKAVVDSKEPSLPSLPFVDFLSGGWRRRASHKDFYRRQRRKRRSNLGPQHKTLRYLRFLLLILLSRRSLANACRLRIQTEL
jgi:hypothetical protein